MKKSETNYETLANAILEAVGGKDNVSNVTHCMTRLRFNLKDESILDIEKIKGITGVIGVINSGGQLQIIIGQTVSMVYEQLCSIGGFEIQKGIEENLDKPKEKLTAKKVGSNILNYISGSLVPLIPVMIAAAMFKTVAVLFGPDMLNWFSETSDLYVLFNFLYEAGFYFFPVFIGYTAAKKLGVTPVLGLFMGAILITPSFMALSGTDFTVYGIPCIVNNYSQTVLPILLSVWIMSYIEKFFNKHVPAILSTIFAPFLTMVVMVPISLCLLAPLGSILGEWIGNGLVGFGNVGGFLAVAVVAALWEFLVMSGMHVVLITFAITTMMQNGFEAFIMPAGGCATWAAFGMALGAAIRIRNKEEKALTFGYFISGIIGGVTEPALYGLGFKYKRPFIGLIIGAFCGGLYAGITNVATYVMGASNFLALIGFISGGTSNLVNGVIASVMSLVIAAIATYFLGFSKDEPAIQKVTK